MVDSIHYRASQCIVASAGISSPSLQPRLARPSLECSLLYSRPPSLARRATGDRTHISIPGRDRLWCAVSVSDLDMVEHAALEQPDDDGDDARDEAEEEKPEEPADVGAGGLLTALFCEPGVAVEEALVSMTDLE